MITVITLIVLVVAVMLVFFKMDILNRNASLNRISETSGFVVCIIALIVIYIIYR